MAKKSNSKVKHFVIVFFFFKNGSPWCIVHCQALQFNMCFANQFLRSVQVVTWICQNCYMNMSKLLHGSVKVVTWICQNCYMDLLKLLHWSVKVFTWICQSCCIDFHENPFFFTTLIVFPAGYKHCDGQRRSRGDQHKRWSSLIAFILMVIF